jgi:hypothetical protein
MEEKVEIEKSILFDKSFLDMSKAIIAAHKKKPTVSTAKMMKNLITFRTYVANLEHNIFVMKDVLNRYRDEFRERDTKDKVL